LGLAGLVCILLAGACSKPATPAAAPSPEKAARPSEARASRAALNAAAEAVPVETAVIVRGPISAFLSFNSSLETEAAVEIYPQTGGQVEAVLAEEGHVVKAGQPLLKIEDRELRVDVSERETNLRHLESNFARTEEMFSRNLMTKQDYDNQVYQLDQSRLALERARLRLSYATVRAPFDGVVTTRDTQVGARVGTGTKLFSLIKLDEIVARVFVPARYLTDVAEGQSAVVTSEFMPGRTFTGWVKRISPIVDPKSGTFRVTVGVRGDNPTGLPPGLFVNVRIVTETRENAVLVPKRAIVYEGGERFAFVVVDGTAHKRRLVAGHEDPEAVEALSGFEPGSRVIVLGHNGLKDGAKVRDVSAPSLPEDPLTAAEKAAVPAPAGT
jgi:membrane fusion protein (multidrug efflux system)